MNKPATALCEKIIRVYVSPRNAHFVGCSVQDVKTEDHEETTAANPMFGQHCVLRATLRSGEEVAVDLAGGALGWRDPLAPWERWADHRVVRGSEPDEFDVGKARLNFSALALPPHDTARVTGAQAHVMRQAMQEAVRGSMGRCGLKSVRRLHRVSDETFRVMGMALRAAAGSALDHVLSAARASHYGRLYPGPRWELRAAAGHEQGEALEDVWLGEETAEALRRDEDPFERYDTRALWIRRCCSRGRPERFAALGLEVAGFDEWAAHVQIRTGDFREQEIPYSARAIGLL